MRPALPRRVRPTGRLAGVALALGLLVALHASISPGARPAQALAGPPVAGADSSSQPAAVDPSVVEAAPVVSSAQEAPPVPTVEAPAIAQAPTPDDPCSEALAWVDAAGLHLPAGVDYRCPSTEFAHDGAACWNDWPCLGSAFVAVNIARIGDASTAYLHHVVAHEVCHILEYQAVGTTTEAHADACAAAHGAPA